MSEATHAETPSGSIHYEIVTPTGRIGTGECTMVVAPAIHGEVGILRNHTPYLAALATGVLRVKQGEQAETTFVSNGFIEVLDNKVIILAETAEKSGDIDVPRAREAMERARKRLETGHGVATEREPVDRMRARRSLDRARARIKASGKGMA
ncbi:MAG: F0F1 ATP synthase subunit epsilon [Candidatus Hydrogenedentota bacterium]